MIGLSRSFEKYLAALVEPFSAAYFPTRALSACRYCTCLEAWQLYLRSALSDDSLRARSSLEILVQRHDNSTASDVRVLQIIYTHVGGMHYVRFIIGENLICRFFYDSPNRQIKVLAKFSRYTVLVTLFPLGGYELTFNSFNKSSWSLVWPWVKTKERYVRFLYFQFL